MKKLLERHIEWLRPFFQPGGKLQWLYPLHEANETFLLTPAEVTHGAPHVRDQIDLKRVMIMVVLALIPATLFGIYNAGYQFNLANVVEGADFWDHVIKGLWLCLPIILVSYAVGGFWEVLFALIRKHPVSEGFLVTGLLFPLTLPPTQPLWQVAMGVTFGTVIGKEIFGGTGFNVLNPALTARAFLYFAYPVSISGDVWVPLVKGGPIAEGFSGATPLGIGAAASVGTENFVDTLSNAGYTLKTLFFGLHPGSIGETSMVAILIGLVILMISGIASWRIILSGLLGLTFASTIFQHFAGGPNLKVLAELPFYYQAMIGSFAFGLVFMATDPVSATATNPGKWVYGFLIGALIVAIRVSNPAYPEATMLVILFMNIMAPLIDHIVLQAHIKRRNRHVHA